MADKSGGKKIFQNMREMVSYLSKYIYFKRVYINQKYFNVLNYVTQIHIQVLNQY